MAEKADVKGVEYAQRKGVNYVYWDEDTGEIMQFLFTNDFKKVDGMFPDRKMRFNTLKEYINKFKIN